MIMKRLAAFLFLVVAYFASATPAAAQFNGCKPGFCSGSGSGGACIPVSPPGVTGVIGWWDASVTISLTLSGSDILSIADLTCGGNTLNGAATKPVYSATGLNSLPSMLFTPSSAIFADLFPMGTGNTLTFWTVSFMSSGTTQFGRNISYTAPFTSDFGCVCSWEVERNNSGNSIRLVRNLNDTGNMAVTLGTPFILIGTIDSSGVQTIYVNGVPSSTATVVGNWISLGGMNLGSARLSGTEFWSGAISEAGVSTDFTNSTNVAVLNLYLKNKWGL